MNHRATPTFWFLYRRLPEEIRELADRCFWIGTHAEYDRLLGR